MTKPDPTPGSQTDRELSREEKQYWAALARKANAEARAAEHEAAKKRLEREKVETDERRRRLADGYDDRVYRFTSPVAESSVTACINQLNAWHREDSACSLEILFDSPGGSVVDGMHLFDHILELREAGHHITTRTRGMAASMAGILLQAGDVRMMGSQASLMIHEASFGASGKIGDVEDTVEWVKKGTAAGAEKAGLSKDGINYLYCYNPTCHLAASAAVELIRLGYRVVEVEGGWSTWVANGYRIEVVGTSAAA